MAASIPFMKKIICIVCLLPFASYAQTTVVGRALLSAKIFLGLTGSTYKTEVPIAVEQIRFQQGSGTIEVMNYTAAAPGGALVPTTPGNPVPPAGAAVMPPHVTMPQVVLEENLVYSLYNDPGTGAPLLAIKPCVHFTNPAGGSALQPGTQFPVGGAHIATCGCGGAIQSREYLFAPAGGKMPNFSQILRHEWFVTGPFSAVVKYRPTIKAMDDLPSLAETWTTGFSLAVVTGVKHSFNLAGKYSKYGRGYKFPISYQFPVLMLGVNTVDVQRRFDADSNGRFDSYQAKESRLAFTIGTGIGLQVWKFAVFPLVGWDFLLGTEKDTWPYQGKVWLGGSIGVSLDKLVGLAK